MIIFLYGHDTYRAGQKAKEIIAGYEDIHKSGLNLRFFDFEDSAFGDFKNAAESVSMFNEKKLLVLKNSFCSKDFVNDFLSWGGKEGIAVSKDIICLFMEVTADKSSDIFKWLAGNARCQEFNELKGTKLKNWSVDFAKQKGILMESIVAERLIFYTGGDLYALHNEISKIASYVLERSGSKTATEGDLNILIKPKLETHIFSLVDSFVEKDKKKALRLLHGHIEAGDNEMMIFSMIQTQFINIAAIKDLIDAGEKDSYRISKILGIHPYVAKKGMWQSARMDKREIKNIYKKFVDTEIKVKTSELSLKSGMENLLFES